MKEPRMWWAGDDKGWIIDVEQPLSEKQIQTCVAVAENVQKQRLLSLFSGDKKDECSRTIQALKMNKVSQNIIGVGDKRLFDAYKSEGKKFFEMGKV